MEAIMWIFVMQINGCCYKEKGDNSNIEASVK